MPKAICHRAPSGGVDVKELRRVQLARETLGLIAIPLVYVLLMASGVFLWRPDLAMVTVALVAFLILQGRAGRLSATLAARGPEPLLGARFRPETLRAADARFLRSANYSSIAQFVGYLVFLAALDLALRQSGTASPKGALFLVMTVVALGVAIAGREAARRIAWKGFAAQFPDVWSGPSGLGGWRGVRGAADYLEWRSGAERRD